MTDVLMRRAVTNRDAARVQVQVSTKVSMIFALVEEHDLRDCSGCTCVRNKRMRQSAGGAMLSMFVQQQRAGTAGAQID